MRLIDPQRAVKGRPTRNSTPRGITPELSDWAGLRSHGWANTHELARRVGDAPGVDPGALEQLGGRA